MTGKTVVVQGLRIATTDGRRCLVDDGCLDLAAGEVLGVVGESGSGKTTLGLALLHHCRRGLRIDGGTVRIDGRNLCAESAAGLRQVRGRVVCYVPQDPASALNPALKIGTQIGECLPREAPRSGRAARAPGRRQVARGAELSRQISAPAFRRTAAACRHRHGLRQPSASHRHGRADDRPRCDHPGARSGDHSRALQRPRGGGDLRESRYRGGRGDLAASRRRICRTNRRDRTDGAGAQRPRASVHARADAGGPRY